MGKRVLILGVTGNIACGKSSVVALLERKGAAVLSADQLAREVVAPGTALLQQLVQTFGTRILASDGRLDREILARLVFAEAGARQRLNALMHPAIGQLAEKRLAELSATGVPLIVYEAPLLFEAGAEKRVDRVLVVTIDSSEQLRRLVLRDGLEADEARRRMAAQMAQEEKVARADYLIDNSGSPVELEAKVDQLWKRLTAQDSDPASGKSC